MSRDPRLEEYTIWTAVAPEAVLTVRTYAAGADYETDWCANPSTQYANRQVTTLHVPSSRNRGPSQVAVLAVRWPRNVVALQHEPRIGHRPRVGSTCIRWKQRAGNHSGNQVQSRHDSDANHDTRSDTG